jgi:hypothetical protein
MRDLHFSKLFVRRLSWFLDGHDRRAETSGQQPWPSVRAPTNLKHHFHLLGYPTHSWVVLQASSDYPGCHWP